MLLYVEISLFLIEKIVYFVSMKKFVICFLLVVALFIVPMIFAGCKNDTPAKSESSSKPSSETTIETSRKFKFERQNNFENINYDFENNKITLKLSSDDKRNVVNFSVKIYEGDTLYEKQSIRYEISNSNEIEIVNFAFTNFYLKFNKTGTYSLKIYDEFEYITKIISIVVE